MRTSSATLGLPNSRIPLLPTYPSRRYQRPVRRKSEANLTAAVQHADAIAAVDGVDVLFVGPSDLSHSMGALGKFDHPDFVAAIDRTARAAKAHGKYSGILGNCSTKVIFATDEEESSEYFSRLIGDATVEEDVRSLTGPRWGLFWRQRGRQGQRHARRLLTPDELRRLPKHQAVLLAPGLPPALIDKVRYYDDPNWQKRAA